jgi:hypothetical protein
MPNAGYEISDTKRYSEKKVEACLIATKDWQRGDEISLLSGIILSPTLFLGPARFANHDCDSNCRVKKGGIVFYLCLFICILVYYSRTKHARLSGQKRN